MIQRRGRDRLALWDDGNGQRRGRHVVGIARLHAQLHLLERVDLMQYTVNRPAQLNADIPSTRESVSRRRGVVRIRYRETDRNASRDLAFFKVRYSSELRNLPQLAL